jgi:hypothetical protein
MSMPEAFRSLLQRLFLYVIFITHKLHEMKSEQAVLPNPCLEEEEEEVIFIERKLNEGNSLYY